MSERKKQLKVTEGYANPRRILTATQEQIERWDSAAEAWGLTWSEWARRTLDQAAPPLRRPPKAKSS